MKRYSPISALLLTLPCVFILFAGIGITRWREAERKIGMAFLSHPFQTQFQLRRSQVAGSAEPRIFEAQAYCTTSGGHGSSLWLLSSKLVTTGKKPSREIWNSQRLLDPRTLSETSRASHATTAGVPPPGKTADGSSGPFAKATFSWGFKRLNKEAENLRLIVEAVVIPIPLVEANSVSYSIDVREVTPAQIAAARQQPGAQYFRKSLELNARDDSKYHFSGDAREP